MKLNEIQLSCFEPILYANNYKRDCSYKGAFSYYKPLINDENFKLYVWIEFYDFRKYEQYTPKEFPFAFEPKIVVIQDSLATELKIPFIYDKKPLFAYYDDKKKCFVEKEWTEREVEKYLEVLEDIGYTFRSFYQHSVEEYITE